MVSMWWCFFDYYWRNTKNKKVRSHGGNPATVRTLPHHYLPLDSAWRWGVKLENCVISLHEKFTKILSPKYDFHSIFVSLYRSKYFCEVSVEVFFYYRKYFFLQDVSYGWFSGGTIIGSPRVLIGWFGGWTVFSCDLRSNMALKSRSYIAMGSEIK